MLSIHKQIVTKPKPVYIKRAQYVHRNIVVCKGSVINTAQIIGDGLGAFVLFYCSLQWQYYRNLRKRIEEENK
ncbi:MAG: hypothetical protein ACO30M_10295, partial [Candidatus Kapaibacteriota bacterium]